MTTTGEVLTRTRSRSTDHNERLEPQLTRAAQSDNVEKLRDLIEAAKAKGQLETRHLSIALVESAGKGKYGTTEYLLSEGAPPNGDPNKRQTPPLLRAVEQNYHIIVGVLLSHGANPDIVDKKGRTPLMMAAWKGRYPILDLLLRRGADVNVKDHHQRNALHNLASDKSKDLTWGDSHVDILLRFHVPFEGEDVHDEDGRTPLHWASATGKKALAEKLLAASKAPEAYIEAVDTRQKTSLHMAVSHGKDDMVEMLIENKANIHAMSDGGWTPLHNACKLGSESIVHILIQAGADVNAKLLNGMTPLHKAAEEGHVQVVEYLLRCRGIKRAARDSFGSTPFLLAAKGKHKEIVKLLAPFKNVASLSEDAIGASKGFNATVVDFGSFHNGNKVDSKKSVFELLYGVDAKNPRKPAMTILADEKTTDFRWIHLPANNMTWVEALLTKLFIEEEARDVSGFKALEKSFSHQHRGKKSHSHFMRPLCHVTPRAPRIIDTEHADVATEKPTPTPTIVLNGNIPSNASNENATPRTPTRASTSTSLEDKIGSKKAPQLTHKDSGSRAHPKEKPNKPSVKGNKSPKTDQKPFKDQNRPRTPNKNSRAPKSVRKEENHLSKANIYTFLPYLHFETSQRCQMMKDAIKRAEWLKASPSRHPARARTHDEMLIRAHLASSTISLHVRRTLDQSFYQNIDTQHRDQDQVVYRYQTEYGPEEGVEDPKIVMVDQMWMWVLGKDLIVTAFPQRWDQPRNDPLNVLESIIEDINDHARQNKSQSKSRDGVENVYELATIITNRCTGVFDRHRMGDEGYQFLDMFEASIGIVTDKETKLFDEFNKASRQASDWLERHQKRKVLTKAIRRPSHLRDNDHPHEEHDGEVEFTRGPIFVDKLLDIGQETKLLAETKDIRDELNMMRKVLEDQEHVLPALEASICDIYREEQRSQQDVRKRFADQLKMIGMHIRDLDRMDKQAKHIYESITDMLDLKQKHANAFEARFARDQATSTARQSQTIMVFTIVTIVFLPMSFIAAFFTINIEEFPKIEGNNLSLAYVSKYMFGIGLSISIPMIFIAFYLDDIGELFRNSRNSIMRRKKRDQEKQGFDGDSDADALDVMRIEQVLSSAKTVRKSMESIWMREKMSIGARPRTPGSVRGDKVVTTGFKDVSEDVERGLRP